MAIRISSRRTFWLSAAILLVAVWVAWFLVPRSRVTPENYDRIVEGMPCQDVFEILGTVYETGKPNLFDKHSFHLCWASGPNFIDIRFSDGKVERKSCEFATLGETLDWYVEQITEKIGIKWK